MLVVSLAWAGCSAPASSSDGAKSALIEQGSMTSTTPAAAPTDSGADSSNDASGCTAESFVAGLRGTLPSLEGQAGLERLRAAASGCSGIGRVILTEGAQPSLFVELTTPMDASAVARHLDIDDPFLITTTVHQSSFHLVSTDTSGSTSERRFHADDQSIGSWSVRAIAKRPAGPLPNEHFGPAPAYDLRTYTSKVTHISIRQSS